MEAQKIQTPIADPYTLSELNDQETLAVLKGFDFSQCTPFTTSLPRPDISEQEIADRQFTSNNSLADAVLEGLPDLDPNDPEDELEILTDKLWIEGLITSEEAHYIGWNKADFKPEWQVCPKYKAPNE